jgi:hypothetical protein
MKRLLLFIYFAVAVSLRPAEGSARLLVIAPDVNVLSGKSFSVEVYLYNDGKQPIAVPPLRFTSAEWTLTDPTGQRLSRGGESRLVSDHGASDVKVKAGSVLHETIELDVKAEPGDLVKVEFWLGENTSLRGNPVLVYCVKTVPN